MIAEEYRALAKATPPGCWKVWAMDPTNEKYYCVGILPNNSVAHKFSETYAEWSGGYYVMAVTLASSVALRHEEEEL